MLLLALACGAAPEVEALRPAVGEVVFVTADELRARVGAAAQRPRLYNFWATWCAPCVEEMPVLRAFAARRPGVDVVLVNLDLPRFHDTKVVPFLHEHGMAHLWHLQLQSDDPAIDLRQAVRDWPDAVPTTLFVDKDGEEVRRFPRRVTDEDLQSLP